MVQGGLKFGLAGLLALAFACSEGRDQAEAAPEPVFEFEQAKNSAHSAGDPMEQSEIPRVTATAALADGVSDEVDACDDVGMESPSGIMVYPTGCRRWLTEDRRFLLDVRFAVGSPKIIALRGTADILALLETFPESQLRIEAHTDSQGAEAANLALSQRRADAVAARFVEKLGVDGARITSAGFGEMQPTTSNRTGAGRAANRRVEAIVVPGERDE